jgi:hypothetical protein
LIQQVLEGMLSASHGMDIESHGLQGSTQAGSERLVIFNQQ